MKNLGSKLLFLFLIGTDILYASVVARVDSKTVVKGDTVTLNLTLTGEDITRPDLYYICGKSEIISTSSQTSIRMINGEYRKNYVLSYQFVPQKSCTIEPIGVEIDGKLDASNPIEITVNAYKKSANDDFELTFTSSAKDVYVGEPFYLNLLFKQKNGAEAVDSKFIQPDFKGFWMKGESKPQQSKKDGFTYTKISYLIAPQREGTLTINPAQMKIATRVKGRNSWGSWVLDVKWKSYFSNKLDIDVKALPQGVSLVGDFKIESIVDKVNIEQNEAVNVTIKVVGKGNIEDIESFKPIISGVSAFDEKIEIKGTTLTQKIAFVADKDFIIPSFSLRYFDLKTKEVKTIFTEEVGVKVNALKRESLTIKRDELKSDEKEVVTVVENKTETFVLFIIFVFGLVIGVVLGILQPWKLLKREKQLSLKDPKVLLIKLMPYKNDKKVSDLIEQLEKNIYSGADIEIDKKLVKELIKEYQFKL
ncbi:MAG: BatD family protein [Campylobacterota bacterium]|nr:BatD family protein [Campylobacterota bacterium]